MSTSENSKDPDREKRKIKSVQRMKEIMTAYYLEAKRTLFTGDALATRDLTSQTTGPRLFPAVWHDNYDAGWAVAEQVKAAFDRSAFALSGDDRVIQMCRREDAASQDEDGIWQFTITFLVQVYLSSGI